MLNNREIIGLANEWKSFEKDESFLETIKSLSSISEVLAAVLPIVEGDDVEWKVRLSGWEDALTNKENFSYQQELAQKRVDDVEQVFIMLQEMGKIRSDIQAVHLAQQVFDLITGLGVNLLFLSADERKKRAESLLSYLEWLSTTD